VNNPQVKHNHLNTETITIISDVLIKNLPFNTYEDLVFTTFLPIESASISKITGHVPGRY
jgi:hypothetical protein